MRTVPSLSNPHCMPLAERHTEVVWTGCGWLVAASRMSENSQSQVENVGDEQARHWRPLVAALAS